MKLETLPRGCPTLVARLQTKRGLGQIDGIRNHAVSRWVVRESKSACSELLGTVLDEIAGAGDLELSQPSHFSSFPLTFEIESAFTSISLTQSLYPRRTS